MTVPSGFVQGEDLDPAEKNIGPFLRYDSSGGSDAGVVTGLLVQARHCNEHGTLHGGVQMALADYTIGVVARFGMGAEGTMTVSFDSSFIDAGQLGEWITGHAEVIRRTGSLVFVQGRLRCGDRPLLAFNGVVKRRRPRG